MKAFLTTFLVLLSFGLALQAQTTTVTAKQSDQITTDAPPVGKANANDVIRYKVDIQNTGANPANGLNFNAVPDARTTFMGGSFRSSPLAFPDAYAVTGNVGISVPASDGLKSNDFDDAPAGLTVTAGTFATSHGSITVAADGSFTYTPTAGYTGTDTYTYTLNDSNPDSGVPATDAGTVTFTVSNLIWFVDNSGSAGDGRVGTPFKTLAAAVAASTAGQVIFVKNTGTKYNGGIVLKNNQYLFGSGHSGGTNLADMGVLPFSVALYSVPLPAIGSTRPIIISPTNGITLASGNTIRGVEVGYCPGGAKIFGSGFGTLTVGNTTSPDVSLNGNQTALNLTNGAFAATSKFASISCLDSSKIVLNTVSGSLGSVSTQVNAFGSGGAITIDIQNSSAALDFGATTVNNFNGQTCISITSSSTGSVTFSNLSMPINVNGPGLVANNGGTINIGGTSSAITAKPALDITNTSFGAGATFASITATGNTKGVNLDNVSGSLVINGGSITNSTSIAFDLNAGSSTVTYAGTISNAARAVEVTGRTGGTVTFSGTITNTGTGINVASNTGGTIAFSGTSKSLNTGGNAAVTLATNTGATVNFTGGGLALTTTSGTGFTATGGGTVTVQGSNNTISSGTGTALNVVNTTIGGSGVTFKSISASGAANGILLNNTGTSGSLTVTGDGNTTVGGNNSGGTIQNTTGVGISLTTTMSPSFTNMRVLNTTGHGVGGTDVTNFTFNYGKIDGSNADALNSSEEANIGFYVNEANSTRNNLDGVVSIIGNQLTNAFYHGIDIFNFSGTISDVTISDNTITSSTSTANSKGSGIRMIGFGSPTTVASITQATISQNTITNFPSGTGIQVQGGNAANNGSNAPHPTSPSGTYGSAANPIAITGNVLNGGASKFGAFGMATVVNGKGSGYYSISGNSVSNSIGTAIAVSSFGVANTTAILTSNTIVANNNVGAQGIGAGTSQTWANTDNPILNVRIGDGTAGGSNNISQTDGSGILVTARDCSSKVNVRILKNTVATPLAGLREGIRVDAGNGVSIDDEVNLEISGNTTSGSTSGSFTASGIGLRKQGTISTTNDFKIVGLPPASTSTPNVENYVNSQNPGSASGNFGVGGTDLISATSGFSVGSAMSF